MYPREYHEIVSSMFSVVLSKMRRILKAFLLRDTLHQRTAELGGLRDIPLLVWWLQERNVGGFRAPLTMARTFVVCLS